MVTLNTVSVTVYIKKKSIACLKVFTPSAMGRFKKPCNCYGPYSLDWPLEGSALPSLQHHNPPPPRPPTLITGLHKYAADQNSDRSVTGSTEPIAWQPEKTAQPTFGDVTTG